MMEKVLGFCDGLPERHVEAGETLLAFGETQNRLYVLIDGGIEVSSDGVQISTQDEPGSVFGEMSVLLGIPHTATVKGFVASRVYVVENAAEFLQSHPDVTFYMAKLLARRLKGATDYLVDVKGQFEDQQGHLGMVDEVLASLMYQQDEECTPGSERDPDTTI